MKNLKKIFTITLTFLMLLTVKNIAFTVVIDPGHGGNDPGAIADNGAYEKDMNFKIAKYLESYLNQYSDVTVHLTHDGNLNEKLEIFDRAILGRSYKPDLLISLHLNSLDSGTANGAEVYVTANTSCDKYNKQMTELGNIILNNLSEIGIANSGVRTKQIVNDTSDKYSDGTMADWYGIIRYSMRGTKIDYGVTTPEGWSSANVEKGEGIPVVLVEHCYIKGSDIQFVDSDEDLQKIAEADGKAIVEYYNLKKEIIIEPSKDATYDIDGNGDTTVRDARFIVEYSVGKRELTEEQQKIADFDADGRVSVRDARKILEYIMK